MLKAIQAEFLKIRHNRFFLISGLIAFCYPLLIALKDILQKRQIDSYFNLTIDSWWIAMQDIFITVLLGILSGLLVTLLFQKEYSERTILIQLTTPLSRGEFLTGKTILWLTWHMALALVAAVSTGIGMQLVYPGEVTIAILLMTVKGFFFHGFMSFLAFLPLMVAAVLQRDLFYPSVSLCLLFTLLGTLSNVLRGTLPYLLPWSAARVLSIMPELPGSYQILCIASISVSAVVGILFSALFFHRQKL